MAFPAPIVILGGSGFLGISLARHLTELGARVVIVSRAAPRVSGAWESVKWDGRSLGAWAERLDGAWGVVNLAGRSVDCIKTPDNCDAILRSRVEATRALGRAMRVIKSPPRVWLQMSTAHIYGDPSEAVCDESSALGIGLAPTVGRAWEEAAREGALATQRLVMLRTSFVVGRDVGAGGGAMARLRVLARLGLGGRVGSGRQGFSWIHERDMNRIFERALREGASGEGMRGAYVASSPGPVSQREFMHAMRKTSHGWRGGLASFGVGLPAPAWAVRIGAPLVMRTDPELALYGRYVMPRRLLDEGFRFEYESVEDALREVMGIANTREARGRTRPPQPLPLGGA
jgi:uncharacterized protein